MIKVIREIKEFREFREFKEIREIREIRVFREFKEIKEIKEIREIREFKEFKEVFLNSLNSLNSLYKSRAKRTTLLMQNFVMPRLCYGSAEQIYLFCSLLNRKVHFSVFTFHFKYLSLPYKLFKNEHNTTL